MAQHHHQRHRIVLRRRLLRRARAESYVQFAVVLTLALLVGAAVLGLATSFNGLFERLGQGVASIGN
jgi:hypothetical protein